MPQTWEDSIAQAHFALTPSDVTVYDPPLRAVRIGTAGGGAVVIETDERGNGGAAIGPTVAYVNVANGERLELPIRRVLATGTTASSIVGWR